MDAHAANMSASTLPDASKTAIIESSDAGAMHMNTAAQSPVTSSTPNPDSLPKSNENTTIVPPRMPRENGFGDFCFGRMLISDRRINYFSYDDPDCVTSRDPWGATWSKEQTLLGSGNASEMSKEAEEAFYSNGKFYWYKLPAELRKRILDFLLAPYFEMDPNTQTELVAFRVSPVHVLISYDDWFERDFTHYLDKIGKATNTSEIWVQDVINEYNRAAPGERDRTREELSFSQVKKAFHFERNQHPERISHYSLEVSLLKQAKNFYGPRKDWPMIDLVRNLSNVNTQFRQELGHLLWARTRMELSFDSSYPYDGTFNAWEPTAFLLHRPAVIKGIKSLYVPLQQGDKGAARFKVFCKYAVKVLSLLHFRIGIEDGSTSLSDVATLKGAYTGIEVVREMKVSKSFDITFSRRQYPPSTPYQVEYVLQIRDNLLPNTLRMQDIPEVDEKTIYLNQRGSEEKASGAS